MLLKYFTTAAFVIVSLFTWTVLIPALISHRSYELPALGVVIGICYFPAAFYFIKHTFRKEVKNV